MPIIHIFHVWSETWLIFGFGHAERRKTRKKPKGSTTGRLGSCHDNPPKMNKEFRFGVWTIHWQIGTACHPEFFSNSWRKWVQTYSWWQFMQLLLKQQVPSNIRLLVTMAQQFGSSRNALMIWNPICVLVWYRIMSPWTQMGKVILWAPRWRPWNGF